VPASGKGGRFKARVLKKGAGPDKSRIGTKERRGEQWVPGLGVPPPLNTQCLPGTHRQKEKRERQRALVTVFGEERTGRRRGFCGRDRGGTGPKNLGFQRGALESVGQEMALRRKRKGESGKTEASLSGCPNT